MCNNSLDFRRGDLYPHLVLLGACPGQDEFKAVPQRPFAGRAGVNLRMLLPILRDLPDKEDYGLRRDDFASDRLDDYTLMNSHAEAKWRGLHRRTLPRMREVEDPINLNRIRAQFRSVDARVVVGLGRPVDDRKLTKRGSDSGPMRAMRIVAAENGNIAFLVTNHPSQQGVNGYGDGNAAQWLQAQLRRFQP